MDAVLLSRIQFALTVGFHFLFPPLTIGMAWIIFWMMAGYMKTGSELQRKIARFWIRILAITFVVGVASGITMEFQFGTNWAAYSRFVGDVFGAPLAAEAILSFFLESTFLAVLILGWDRVSVRVHWFSSLMVAVGATLSAFWIIVANSWQQTPAGFHLANGRAELTSFGAAVFNPSTLPRFFHTMDAAFVTGSMFIMGMAAWFLLKNRNVEFAKESFKSALLVAFVASVLQLPLGHVHARQVVRTQPAKLAAFEALFQTQCCAPAVAAGVPRPSEQIVAPAISIKGLLSLLAYGNYYAKVTGLDAFPRDQWPPVALTFYSFHTMVMLGMYFLAMTALGVWLLWRGTLFRKKWYMWLALLSIPLPLIANELGWITAEVGRQPWIVYNLLRTRDAISINVPAGQILLTLILFIVIYALLFAAWVVVLRKRMIEGPEAKT